MPRYCKAPKPTKKRPLRTEAMKRKAVELVVDQIIQLNRRAREAKNARRDVADAEVQGVRELHPD